jgi:hypothetical protein
VELETIGGWEPGTTRLHLGSNGLIVGTKYVEAGHFLFVYALSGTPAAAQPLPRLTDFGLEATYGDCICQSEFVIDAAGTTFYWVDSDRGVVMAAPIADPTAHREVGRVPFDYPAIDVSREGVVVTQQNSGHTPVLLTNGAASPLAGTYATVGPNG